MFVRRQWLFQKVMFYAQLAKGTYSSLSKQLKQQVQAQLERLIKDLSYCALDVDIPIESNIAEKSLFTRTVIVIEHFWPV